VIILTAGLALGLGGPDERLLGPLVHTLRAGALLAAGVGLSFWLARRPRPRLGLLIGFGALTLATRTLPTVGWLEAVANLALSASLCGLAATAGSLSRSPRSWIAAAIFLVAAATHAAPILAHLRSQGPVAPNSAPQEIVVATANLLWHNASRGRGITRLARDPRVDVLGLVEVPPAFRFEVASKLTAHWPHQAFWPADRADWERETWGMALLSRFPLDSPRLRWPAPLTESTNPVLEATVRLGKRSLAVAVTHLPRPRLSVRGLSIRRRAFAGLGDLEWDPDSILMGDFNATAGSRYFRRLLEDTPLRDSRRGFGVQATWPRELAAIGLGLPLDHVLLGPGLMVRSRERFAIEDSDHLAVVVRFVLGEP